MDVQSTKDAPLASKGLMRRRLMSQKGLGVDADAVLTGRENLKDRNLLISAIQLAYNF